MIGLTRRKLLTGLLAAPIVIRTPGLLMPVKARPRFRIEELLAEGEFRTLHTTGNPAVVFLNLLQDSGLSQGHKIDWNGLGAAADYCDEMVPA